MESEGTSLRRNTKIMLSTYKDNLRNQGMRLRKKHEKVLERTFEEFSKIEEHVSDYHFALLGEPMDINLLLDITEKEEMHGNVLSRLIKGLGKYQSIKPQTGPIIYQDEEKRTPALFKRMPTNETARMAYLSTLRDVRRPTLVSCVLRGVGHSGAKLLKEYCEQKRILFSYC